MQVDSGAVTESSEKSGQSMGRKNRDKVLGDSEVSRAEQSEKGENIFHVPVVGWGS